MSIGHNFSDLVERFSMGALNGIELANFEEHLLLCAECQDAVRRMDGFLAALGSVQHLQSRDQAEMFVVPRKNRRAATILKFRTHLPQYSLEAAAGKFGRQQMSIQPEGWVEVDTNLDLTDDMFVIHVNGKSMEPRILDGSRCAFTTRIGPLIDGKVLLIEQYGEPGGSRYTVKLCRISETADPNHTGDLNRIHPQVILESINPAYKPLDNNGNIRALAEFLFVVDPPLAAA
jgi:hypothetical protein